MIKIDYKTKLVRGSTTRSYISKRYGELRTFKQVSPKMYEITYFPKPKRKKVPSIRKMVYK